MKNTLKLLSLIIIAVGIIGFAYYYNTSQKTITVPPSTRPCGGKALCIINIPSHTVTVNDNNNLIWVYASVAGLGLVSYITLSINEKKSKSK
jgi:hypothetical protein